MTLEEAKEKRYGEINYSYLKDLNGLCSYDIDGSSTINMAGGMELLEKMNVLKEYAADYSLPGLTLRDQDNTQYPVTIEQFEYIRVQIRDGGIQKQGKKSALYDLIEAATTIEEVQAISW